MGRGIYILVIGLAKSRKIRIGKLGVLEFSKGLYAYAGSAQNNLEKRIERHRSRKENRKKLFWHIDYLLEKGRILEVYTKPASKEQECETAKSLERKFKSISKFGCSDCNCRSHLFFLD